MSYYTLDIPFVAGTLAEAYDVNYQFTMVQSGFALAETDINNKLSLTGGTVTGAVTFQGASTFTNAVTVGGYTLPAADGTANQIIETDGAGNLSFVNKPSVITDHGALTGLTDDDHTQYALADASRGFTNALTIGAITIPATDGTSGQVLQTDGLGTLTWATPSAGVTDHGALTGLTDDDHTQYLLSGGLRQHVGDVTTTIKASGSETGNVFELQNSSGTAVVGMTHEGHVGLNVAPSGNRVLYLKQEVDSSGFEGFHIINSSSALNFYVGIYGSAQCVLSTIGTGCDIKIDPWTGRTLFDGYIDVVHTGDQKSVVKASGSETSNIFEVQNSSAVASIAADADATAGNTRFLIYDVDNATLERVSVGAADSGGAGFKVLRIPN